MDGLSAAGGVFAVVSLAIELVSTVREVRRFVRNVADAPEELVRLEDLLMQLEYLLETVILILDGDKIKVETAFSRSIGVAVLNCQTKLKTLEDLIQKFHSVANGERRLSRIWGSVKLASKEQYIKDFECNLQQALTTLNVALTANNSNAQRQDYNTIISELHTLRREFCLFRNDFAITSRVTEGLNTGNNLASGHIDKSSTFQVSRHHSTMITRYETFLGTFCNRHTETTMAVYQDHELPRNIASKQTKSSWLFFPTFLSRCIELEFYNSYKTVPPSLRMNQVIHDKDPIWTICSSGDAPSLQTYLNSNRDRISPFVVNAWGHGLLHFAVLSQNVEICRVLFQLGVKPNTAVDEDGREALDYLNPYDSAVPSKRVYPLLTLKLFISTFPDSVESHVLRFWDKLNIATFEGAIETFITPDNINILGDSPIICAWRTMTEGVAETDAVRWVEALKKLIRLGADIHQVSERRGLCLLHELLEFAGDPLEADSLYTFWLDILFWSDVVDITRYFEIELDYYHKRQPIFLEELRGRKRYLTVYIDIYGEPRFSWDWWIDPKGPAHDVLEEFRNFGPPWHNIPATVSESITNPVDNFPFVYRLVHNTDQPLDLRSTDALQNPDSRSFQLRLWNKRGERRRKQKAVKLAKAKGLYGKPSTLPGAWID